ncbi:MAG TPA: carbamoyltransferase C-terminal domain-containing protein [Allosphingosinicella sp.]|nr:carbamoyltransferase C-terminal domain-containing protein [Allosphingosinicella sp.]
MRILGLNSGRAAPPRHDPAGKRRLADGSAALLVDGDVACAALEERHCRIKYAGGFAHAAPAVLADAGCTIEDVDAVGLSTCCDSPWGCASDRLDLMVEELGPAYGADRIWNAWSGRVHCVDHHDSHAALAFYGCGWGRALVGVIDGFGNRRDGSGRFHLHEDWWRGSFDRQTFYLAEWVEGRMRLERVSESATSPDAIGLAELYRGVTHFCGWPSYQFAGKTMALSAFGDRRRLERLVLADIDERGKARVRLRNRHDDPLRQVSEALAAAGYEIPDGLHRPASPAEPFLADIAALAQHQVEASLAAEVSELTDRYRIQRVALAGGLAMNCVGLGRLAAARPDLEFYVPPAPGDTGQGLGNAIWLGYAQGSPVAETSRPRGLPTASLGPAYGRDRTGRAVELFAATRSWADVRSGLSDSALAQAALSSLSEGRIIGVRSGRAEYGPRALGQCSILADPRDPDAHGRVNRIKKREDFRPFAASILQEHCAACFDVPVFSPFMSFAASATPYFARAAPAVVHVDGTTRYQSVTGEPSPLQHLLEQTGRAGAPPVILNTSFNMAGEPMVETPENALNVFERSGLDGLILGEHWIVRR